jgi:hypothetical protein
MELVTEVALEASFAIWSYRNKEVGIKRLGHCTHILDVLSVDCF